MTTITEHVVNRFSDLYLDEKSSDVLILIDNVKLSAHSKVLAHRCKYFEAMFASGMVEATSKHIEIRETSIDAFKAVLKWIYTGTINLGSLGNAFEILRLARMYEMTEVVDVAVCYFEDHCTVDSVCLILNEAILNSLDSLTDFAMKFVADKPNDVLKHGSFNELSTDAINVMLTRAVFAASNRDVFYAVVGWMKANPTKSADFPDVLKNVPLYTITLADLAVVPSDVLDANVFVDLTRQQQVAGPACCLKDENVVAPKYGVYVVTGGDSSFFNDNSKGILEHTIKSSDDGIFINLDRQFKLNSFKMQLVDTDKQNFSYWIAVSDDNVNWTRVIDHSKYLCRSLQNLYFKPRSVRFIRICGTGPVDGTFKISSFEASYTTEPFEVDPETTLVIPSENVALTKKGATIVHGLSYYTSMIDGFSCYPEGTHHNIGEQGIIVQLPQPYLLDSMKLLLWNQDDGVYSYNIKISVDQVNWTRVFSEEEVSSWREIHFDRQPVVFIKVTGTYNSVFHIFRCVYLECPVITRG
uniref:BTB domain-containing protein n=1 Tax=Panagrellus redivivus TaxID=6233 RepID=A0A7E4UTL9_PANRE